MIKQLLSRLMGATTDKRSTAKRQRGLAFEQMEDRLALSTTTGAEIDLQVYALNTTHGGMIAFSTMPNDGSAFLDFSGLRYQSVSTPTVNGIRDSIYFGDTVNFGDADSLNSWHSNQESTIPQPIFGNVENSNGIVSIGAIFENQSLAKSTQVSTANVAITRSQAASELAPAIVTVNEVSMARGREMYFDVAEVSGNELRSRAESISSDDRLTMTRVSFNTLANEREEVRTAAATTVPTNNAVRASTGRGTQADSNRTSEPAESVLDAVPTVLETELPALPQEKSPQGEKVSAVSARDQALAEWRRREFLDSDDVLSARTDESDEDSSSWPILAALAVGGLVVRSRRLAGSSLWHQQLPRRRKSTNL